MLTLARSLKQRHMKKTTERRFDCHGEIRLMARADGHVMVRRPRCMPFVLTEKQWHNLRTEPGATVHDPEVRAGMGAFFFE
jgi:hypothetical protein